MDLLEFQAEQLYFDEPIDPAATRLVERAAQLYGQPEAEDLLMKAYFLEPEHLLVLVALYRYFYYQHRLSDALRVGERVLRITARNLGLPEDWRELDRVAFENTVLVSMTGLRFYMLALKGAGYLELRLGDHESALQRLQKVADLDDKDRLGAQALLDVAREALNEQDSPLAAQA
jgi:tetratricopeptide (TPR) repeat protein